ncbi:MAG: hypothetical protein V2B13_14425 [Pseudomonadota bacterium]
MLRVYTKAVSLTKNIGASRGQDSGVERLIKSQLHNIMEQADDTDLDLIKQHLDLIGQNLLMRRGNGKKRVDLDKESEIKTIHSYMKKAVEEEILKRKVRNLGETILAVGRQADKNPEELIDSALDAFRALIDTVRLRDKTKKKEDCGEDISKIRGLLKSSPYREILIETIQKDPELFKKGLDAIGSGFPNKEKDKDFLKLNLKSPIGGDIWVDWSIRSIHGLIEGKVEKEILKRRDTDSQIQGLLSEIKKTGVQNVDPAITMFNGILKVIHQGQKEPYSQADVMELVRLLKFIKLDGKFVSQTDKEMDIFKKAFKQIEAAIPRIKPTKAELDSGPLELKTLDPIDGDVWKDACISLIYNTIKRVVEKKDRKRINFRTEMKKLVNSIYVMANGFEQQEKFILFNDILNVIHQNKRERYVLSDFIETGRLCKFINIGRNFTKLTNKDMSLFKKVFEKIEAAIPQIKPTKAELGPGPLELKTLDLIDDDVWKDACIRLIYNTIKRMVDEIADKKRAPLSLLQKIINEFGIVNPEAENHSDVEKNRHRKGILLLEKTIPQLKSKKADWTEYTKYDNREDLIGGDIYTDWCIRYAYTTLKRGVGGEADYAPEIKQSVSKDFNKNLLNYYRWEQMKSVFNEIV